MGAPRPLPAVAGAKTKNFPYLSSFPRGGGGGEPTKNGKEIFDFASPLLCYPQLPLPLRRGGTITVSTNK